MASNAGSLKQGVVAMTAANAVALVVVAGSYLLYSRLLTPAEFGIYAGALAIARLGQTVLDGGLKLVLVKHSEVVSAGVLRALFIGSASAGLLTVLLVSIGSYGATRLGALQPEHALFFAAYGAAYFLTYPFIFIPLAQLERAQRFTPVAWAETLGFTIEYALPAVLWLFVEPGFWSFVLAAWLGRMARTALILTASSDRVWLGAAASPEWRHSTLLLHEGFALQLAISLSLLRDNLHLLVVGPWFGKEWAGFYAWVLQMCTVASQVFVQTATRVALPALRLMQGMDARWRATLTQIAWLTIVTAPPLIFLTDLAAAANTALFNSQWTPALALLPFLVVRMLPSLATTPLASTVLADRGALAFARANAWWTGGEVISALLMLWWLGPVGLAWSYAFMAWLGVAAFVHQLAAPAQFVGLLVPLLARPSLWVAMVLLALYRWTVDQQGLRTDLPSVALLAFVATLICVALEPRCWRILQQRRWQRTATLP